MEGDHGSPEMLHEPPAGFREPTAHSSNRARRHCVAWSMRNKKPSICASRPNHYALGIGIALGTSLGVAFGHLAVGIALGAALGAALSSRR